MNEWISVEDRLPTESGEYLCYSQTSYGEWMNIVRFTLNLEQVDDYNFRDKNCSGWYDYDSEWGYFEKRSITHWMLLPEAPKDII